VLNIEDIYTKTILDLASNIPALSRLDKPDVTVTRGVALCGSTITIDLHLKNNKIVDIGLDVRTCALGKASATVFVENARGLNFYEVKKLRENLAIFLKTGIFKIEDLFQKYKYFEAAKLVPYRHDSILLILDATIEGIDNFINTSDKE